jgi:hypothetical protein
MRPKVSKRTVFLTIPYDDKFENLFLAYIAGLSGFGLIPRATLEIAGSRRRLERIIDLISSCPFSLHDLSRVQLDHLAPRTPRFNMPFELGLVVALNGRRRRAQRWFVFEEQKYRLSKSLSDLDGTDPYIHSGSADGVLRALMNAFSRGSKGPKLDELKRIYLDLRRAAREVKKQWDGSLFEASPFAALVIAAVSFAEERIGRKR